MNVSFLIYLKWFPIICGIYMMIGCSEISVNKIQYNSTIDGIDCYVNLVNKIRNNSILRDSLVSIRRKKKTGDSDPVIVKQNYRLIGQSELELILRKNIELDCRNRFYAKNDFLGIRFIDNNLIIFEIDRFNRHTLSERFSSGNTFEIHRLVFSREKPNLNNYSFGGELEVMYEKLSAECYYQITQLKTIHGSI